MIRLGTTTFVGAHGAEPQRVTCSTARPVVAGGGMLGSNLRNNQPGSNVMQMGRAHRTHTHPTATNPAVYPWSTAIVCSST